MTRKSDSRALASSGMAVLAPAAAAMASLAIYLGTLVREVDWGDSAELALQAFQLGVTHPPGYPVHTLLGKLFTVFFHEPALGTNVLSAVSSSLAVGLVSWTALQMTGSLLAALLSGLAFGLSPLVWEEAVVTEVYGVNVCCVALAIAMIVAWYRRGSSPLLHGAAVAFGISLGCYLPNLLFLPAFIILVLQRSHWRWQHAACFLVDTVAVGSLLMSWSVFRSPVVHPMGSVFVPDTPAGLWRYLVGAEYGTAALQPLSFYVRRLVDHGLLFAKNYLGLGILLGLLGLGHQWRTQRPLSIALLAVFVINFGYFTGYNVTDYRYMVLPSYLVFALWIAIGISVLLSHASTWVAKMVVLLVCLGLVSGLLFWKLPPRLARSRRTEVTDFARSSFEALPQGAVVVAAWRRFAPLTYFQRTRNLRSDLLLLQRIDSTRHYEAGAITDWREYTRSLPASTPVFVDRLDMAGPGARELGSIGDTWYQITWDFTAP
jgi:hypothetical protein